MLKATVELVAKGFCMGAADVVPGVSGGTMAFILGIYTRFIDAIKSFDLQWLQACVRLDVQTALKRPHFAFILPLAAGIFIALMFFTRVIPLPRLLLSDPEMIYGLFFGLVLASIGVLLSQLDQLSVRDGLPLLFGIALGAVVVTAVPTETPQTWWFVMLCGALAICAMVVPGISGSFVLLILGKYAYILNALGHFNLAVIVPFAAGAGFGLFAFSRALSWVLHHFERQSLLGISGILVASLWVIWPFQQRSYVEVRGKSRLLESAPFLPELSLGLSPVILMVAAGLALVLGLTWLARERETH